MGVNVTEQEVAAEKVQDVALKLPYVVYGPLKLTVPLGVVPRPDTVAVRVTPVVEP